jgi:hypothetical protein
MKPATQTRAAVAAVERYVRDMHYPARKRDLIAHARENGAPDDVMEALACLPSAEYDSAAEVAQRSRRLRQRPTRIDTDEHG